MIYLLHAVLAGVVFLILLNGFLRGRWKPRIEAVLSVMWIAILCVLLWRFGWGPALLAVVASFVYGAVLRSPAARAAARLFSMHEESGAPYVSLPDRTLRTISAELGAERSADAILSELRSGSQERRLAEEALLNYCFAQHEVRIVVESANAGRDTLREVYERSLRGGAGQWVLGHYVAASALAYPEPLRFLLEGHREGRDPRADAAQVVSYFQRGTPLYRTENPSPPTG